MMMIALVALILRALVPAGYMPDMDGKVFHVTICTIDGPQEIAVDGKMQPVADHPVKEKCAFALLGHSPMSFNLDVAFVITPYQISELQRLVFKDQAVRRIAYEVAQPRGPPVAV